MKIVLSWLSQSIALSPQADTQTLCTTLINLGHEIDGLSGGTARFPHVVVGHITQRVQHPQADRLGVCQVDVGAAHGGIRQIVCGAPNARDGLTVAVALPGAVLPDDFKIGASKIRGVESNGMICSVKELGLGEDHAGIWELNTDKPVGTPLDEILEAPETVLDVAITPNRGDCLSHLGLARDLAAAGLGTLIPLPALEKPSGEKGALTLGTTTPSCPVMYGVALTGVTNAPSPAAIQRQLTAAGLRPRSAVVDATNYVMMSLGQPLHAYDAAKVKGGITAAQAQQGETFHGLNDTTLTLTAEDTVIRDESGIVGLAGILGGSSTAVADTTTSVLLEGAVFTRAAIALTGQRHGLHTDARARFERGIDPALTAFAVQWAAQLICEWTGAKAGPLLTAGMAPAAPTAITYSPAFCGTYGGLHVEPAKQAAILTALGFKISDATQATWHVTPPTWRTHMDTPEDLVEEILRVTGYDAIPSTLPPSIGFQGIDGAPVVLDRLARKAVALAGCTEILTYSFIGQSTAERFAEGQPLLSLANPLAETSMTTLRPGLLPGLLQALEGNQRRQESSPRLAEVGKVYAPGKESLMAAAVLSPTGIRAWHGTPASSDVFAAKALALQVLETLGAPTASLVTTPLTTHPSYHPGKAGTLSVGPMVLARFGELHPTVVKAFKLKGQPLSAVEWFLEPLLKLKSKAKTFTPTPYPAVQRDLALILPNEVAAGTVQSTLAGVDRTLIKRVDVFDRYEGPHVPQGHHSLALGFTFQSPERTLTEADITALTDALLTKAKEAFHATLRA